MKNETKYARILLLYVGSHFGVLVSLWIYAKVPSVIPKSSLNLYKIEDFRRHRNLGETILHLLILHTTFTETLILHTIFTETLILHTLFIGFFLENNNCNPSIQMESNREES